MRVMLDTNICIYLIKKQPPAVLERFTAFPVGDIGISIITWAELVYGACKSRAHAMSLGARVVTNDLREFQRIPDLRIENWV